MASFTWPPQGGSGGVSTYANFAALPVSANHGDLAVTLDTNSLYEYTGSSWVLIGGPSAVVAIGPIDSQTPSSNGAVIASNALVMQSASATVPGLVNLATQSFAGNKTFTGTIGASNLSGTNTGDVTLGTANGLGILGQVLSLQAASTSLTGALTSTDWNTFNSKQAALTIGNLTDVGTDGIVVTGGTGSIIGSGTSLAQHVADTSHNGYLSSTDWNTFNGKQASLTIGNLTDVGTDGIVITGGTGAIIGSGTSIAQHVADTTHSGYLSSTDWNTFNGKQTSGSYITALTGDVTASGPGSVAATIGANKVTNSQLAQMTTLTIKGNSTGGTANASDLSVTTVTSMLNNMVGDSGSGGTKGLVPAPGSGDAAAGKFLKADATWAVPPGSGSTADSSLDINNLALATSVATNALTVALKNKAGNNPSSGDPVLISFRSSTVTSGVYVQRSIQAATSVVIPSGGTIGTVSALAAYIYVYAIDNAGTVELAVTMNQVDEGSLQSTTAISGASGNSLVMYSTTARTSVAVRLIGRMIITESTAGTWASNATELVPAWMIHERDLVAYARYTKNNSQTSFTSGVATIVQYNSQDIDTCHLGTQVSTGSSWKFTALIPGLYRVSTKVVVSGGVSTSETDIILFKNGSSGAYLFTSTSVFYTMNGTTTVSLIPGDFIDVRFVDTFTGTTSTLPSATNETYIDIERVGSL